MPGRALCAAAATAPIVDFPGHEDGIGHVLDAAYMQDLLKKNRN